MKIKDWIRKRALQITSAKEAPAEFELSGPGAKNNDYYDVSYVSRSNNRKFRVVSVSNDSARINYFIEDRGFIEPGNMNRPGFTRHF